MLHLYSENIWLAALLFAVGLVCLIKGGDWFVDAASDLARRLRIPELIIGATVVSIGTTLPEVMVSAASAVTGHSQIAYGNAIGSVICNTALIAALTIAIRPSDVDRKALRVPVLFFFGAAVLYAAIVYFFGGQFSRAAGILLLVIFAAYMAVSIMTALKNRPQEADAGAPAAMPVWREILQLVGSAALIAVGASLLIDNGTVIARAFGVPESVIALTFIALGTSLPELVTAITALAKGHAALSLGNIIGANLFNLVLVSGLSITLAPFSVPTEKTLFGVNATYIVDLPMMMIVMALLTLPALKTGKEKRWVGVVLLALYAAFVVYQFI